MRSSLVAAFFALAALGPIALIACSNGDDEGDTQGPSEDEIKKKKLGLEGEACNDAKKCASGLLCKPVSHGPPPGALGLPMPPSTPHGGPPPGTMGMPLPPQDGSCQQPAPGEEGGTCSSHQACNAGLQCVYPSGGSSTGGPPPGTMGMPILPQGKCKPSTGSSTSGSGGSGPPPGALGMPLPPHT